MYDRFPSILRHLPPLERYEPRRFWLDRTFEAKYGLDLRLALSGRKFGVSSNIIKEECASDPSQVLDIARARSLWLLVGTVNLGRRADRRLCSARDRRPAHGAPALLAVPLPALVLTSALSVVADAP